MAAIELRLDLSTLLDATLSGDSERIISSARTLLEQDRNADALIGRLGILAAQGDAPGYIITSLAAAAMLARFLRARPAPLDAEVPPATRALPVFVRALQFSRDAVGKGRNATIKAPQPYFPSELVGTDTTINEVLANAIAKGDSQMTERVLLGFYGTGADYRTLQVRTYEALSNTFNNNGLPLIYAVRGYQLLDTVEWSRNVPPLIHWLAPRLPQQPDTNTTGPTWIKDVQSYVEANSITSIRTRLSTPKNKNALPLLQTILSNADTRQILQAVHDTVLQGEASPRAVASVIALAAAELVQKVGDTNRALFIRAAHPLLFAAAASTVFHQVQDVEVFNLLFTAAAYVNAQYKELATQTAEAAKPQATTHATQAAAGGLIAVTQLETLETQLHQQDFAGALNTSERFIKLGHDARALFGTIGLGAALNNAPDEEGASLQIVHAAGSEFAAWPKDLAGTNIDAFLHAALRAVTSGKQDALASQLYK